MMSSRTYLVGKISLDVFDDEWETQTLTGPLETVNDHRSQTQLQHKDVIVGTEKSACLNSLLDFSLPAWLPP